MELGTAHRPEVAIISENTLSSMALRSLISDVVPGIDVVCYRSMDEYRETQHIVAHHFVSAAVAFHNPEIFQPLMRRTIVITEGSATPFTLTGYRTIDATASESDIARAILEIRHAGHPARGVEEQKVSGEREQLLSARERDVLSLVVRGYINKEIADELNISLATVVFHRNNICEKLNTRSIGRLTIYAVLNNIVALSEI